MNYVREEDIKSILKLSEIKVETVFDKCTNVLVKLPNGFVLSASSGAVDIDNYNERLGIEICMKKIEDELWKLEGYALAKNIHEKALEHPKEPNFKKQSNCSNKNLSFRDVYIEAIEGKKIRRKHWNGYWTFEKEVGSFMMHCIYGTLDIRKTTNVLFTLGNILADDWEVIK